MLGNRAAEAVIADRGYDSDAIVAHVEAAMNTKAVIPPRSNRKQPRNCDHAMYKLRNRIVRCLSKHFRRPATRYEKSRTCFAALVALACSWIVSKLYLDAA